MTLKDWLISQAPLDIESLQLSKAYSIKIKSLPYFNLGPILHNRPGIRIPKDIIGVLISIYNYWEHQIKEINLPANLYLCIYDICFDNSGVVTLMDGYHLTEYFTEELITSNKDFPLDYFAKYNSKFNDFHWKGYNSYTVFYDSEMRKEVAQYSQFGRILLYEEFINYIKNNHYTKKLIQYNDGTTDIKYSLNDNFWIGEK